MMLGKQYEPWRSKNIITEMTKIDLEESSVEESQNFSTCKQS